MGKADTRAPFGCFVDRTQEPSLPSVRKALAGSRPAWDDLEAHMTDVYGLKSSFHFMYGARYGWAFRFHRSGRLILAMYPNRGHLTVQIILGRAQVALATAMNLQPRVRKVLESAKNYPEGRWLFIPVQSVRHACDLRSLIALKFSHSQRGSVAGQARNRRDTQTSNS